MYGLQLFTNARTGERFRALIRNNEPHAQADVMFVKERVAKTTEGDVIVSEDRSEYFALQHDLGGLSARPAVRSYRLTIAPIRDLLHIYRPSRDIIDDFGRPVADQFQTVAENVKAVVENKVRVKQAKTPAQLLQIAIRRILCSICTAAKGDLVSINGSEELAQIIEVDRDTWNDALLILTLKCV